jgi:NADH:quinone reductase (non-electrogenic)
MPPRFNTWLTRTTGVRVPFIQGGMQNVGRAEIVSAVAEAGALGFITAYTFSSPEALKEEIQKVRAKTKKPFGVNFTLLPAINPPDYDAFAKVAVAEGITIFETSGNPMPILPTLRSINSIIIHKCVSIRHAKKAQSLGVDAISIDGFECAGHPGEDDVTSLILLARCQQELQIPYIASGGFADARGAAAAFALGACAVNMGTRWLCTVEAPIHDNIKRALVGAKETDTNLILKRLNNSVRCFKNEVSDEVAEIERSTADFTFDQVKALMAGARGREAYDTGNIHAGIWSAGQSQALIFDVPTCRVLVDRLERDTIEILRTTPKMIIEDGPKL